MEEYYYEHPRAQVFEIVGPEASDFLHRLSTIHFKNFKDNDVKYGAFLTGKGTVLSLFTAWKNSHGYTLFFESGGETAIQYLNSMHFAEDLKILKSPHQLYEYRGTRSISGYIAFNWGIPGAFIQTGDVPSDAKKLNSYEWRMLKATYGIPELGTDITTDHILIEGPFEQWVDRNKGCYPGQEVIEKIYTYGRLPKKIFKVKTTHKTQIKTPIPLSFEDQNIGTLTSVYVGNTEAFGLATLKKTFTDKFTEFVLDGQVWTVEKT